MKLEFYLLHYPNNNGNTPSIKEFVGYLSNIEAKAVF
jgi:hypothetical protein